jgi:hypothetical protein
MSRPVSQKFNEGRALNMYKHDVCVFVVLIVGKQNLGKVAKKFQQQATDHPNGIAVKSPEKEDQNSMKSKEYAESNQEYDTWS